MTNNYGALNIDKRSLSINGNEILNKGYTVLKNVLDDQTVESLLRSSYEILNTQESSFTVDELKSIKELDIVRSPLCFDRKFLDIVALSPRILSVLKELLGSNFQLHLQNVIFNRPNSKHNQSLWHRDLPYQPFIPSHPFSISVMVPLSKFDVHTGGTRVIDSSHRATSLDLEHQVVPELEAGDALLFDSFLWHSSGDNKSSGTRVGINNMYTTPIIKQQIELYPSFKDCHLESELVQNLLGYTWKIPTSVDDYRKLKLSKTIRK